MTDEPTTDQEPTVMEAMTMVATESPDAAGLMAALMEHSAREREMLLPTWETVERREQAAFDRGYDAGYSRARNEIYDRIFGEWEELG